MNIDNLPVRKSVFDISTELVEPIVEKHGLQPTQQTFAAFNIRRESSVEQHIDLILRVANWLLEEDQ